MSLTITYQTATYGTGHDWEDHADRGGVGGLLSVKAKTADLRRTAADGEFKGRHYREAPVVTFALVTAKNVTPAACLDLVDELVAVWAVLPDGTEETVTVEMYDHLYSLTGAPISVDVDLADLKSGCAYALVSFKVYDANVALVGS